MKVLYIVRGLPGSGKSTVAKKLVKKGRHIESDMYFMKNGKYMFDIDKLSEAHKWCQNKTEEMLKESSEDVAVSNVFSLKKYIKPYIELAKKYKFKVSIIECYGKFGDVHNVPSDVILKMRSEWEYIKH